MISRTALPYKSFSPRYKLNLEKKDIVDLLTLPWDIIPTFQITQRLKYPDKKDLNSLTAHINCTTFYTKPPGNYIKGKRLEGITYRYDYCYAVYQEMILVNFNALENSNTINTVMILKEQNIEEFLRIFSLETKLRQNKIIKRIKELYIPQFDVITIIF